MKHHLDLGPKTCMLTLKAPALAASLARDG